MKVPIHTNRRSVLQTVGAGVGGVALAGCLGGQQGGKFEGELDEARSATSDYTDASTAYEDGFVVPGKDGPMPLEDVQEKGHSVCGMGFHFAKVNDSGKPARFGSTDLSKPAVLVYGVDADGNFVLGAVEWVVPKKGEYETESPDIFEHDDGAEEWGTLPTPEGRPDMWTLHAWVHTENPDGVLTEVNPDERFHPEGCEEHKN